jgi:Na+/proline symporter
MLTAFANTGFILPLIAGAIAVISLFLTHRAQSTETFFQGISAAGRPPTLLTLVFSQVTTWIFARSLMNAAILGFYYGIWGTLAYAFYYLSFITGGLIIDSLRFRHGCSSIQEFLHDRFGGWGTLCFNFVIGIRLVSEVFANLLVIGILFGAVGSALYTWSIVGFALVTLLYAMLGGLRASLRTDVFQMSAFLVTLLVLLVLVATEGLFNSGNLFYASFDVTSPGPVLMLVALLQVWSYPMHDPVMMDRGFLADRKTTRLSFLHAAWISVLCITAFGSLGVLAGAQAIDGEAITTVLQRLLGEGPMLLFNAALLISAMSTLDSTLSSSSKLVAVDTKLLAATVANGRWSMAIFMLLGLLLVFWGNKDLFSAVAVSGTASLFLLPVVLFSVWGGRRDIPVWSYVVTFLLAIGGAALYFTESSGYTQWMGDIHKYTKLLYISIVVILSGCSVYALGMLSQRGRQTADEAGGA